MKLVGVRELGVGRQAHPLAPPPTEAAEKPQTEVHDDASDDGGGAGAARNLRKRRGRWCRCRPVWFVLSFVESRWRSVSQCWLEVQSKCRRWWLGKDKVHSGNTSPSSDTSPSKDAPRPRDTGPSNGARPSSRQ